MRRLSLGLLALAIVAPGALSAQMEGHENSSLPTMQDDQIEDYRTMGEKFVALAGAFSEEQYDWRPMEGVRSVRDVLALAIGEFYLFPRLWGTAAPEGIPGGFGEAMAQFQALTKAEMIDELTKSSAHFIASLESLSHEDQMSEASFFGTAVTVAGAISRASGDMHEHLGQSIAYARTNHVVPPWSN
jgi:DinB family protein